MRSWCLALFALFLVGCADVEQSLVWLEDGRIAWRWRAAPTGDSDLDLIALAAAVAPSGQTLVRAWTERDGDRTWHVVQARVDSAEAWLDFRAALVHRVEAVVGPIPPAWAPPVLSRADEGWAVDLVPDTPGGAWSLTVKAPRLRAEGGEPGEPDVVRFSGDRPARAVIADPKPHPMAFVMDGGPALACALAGLGLLIWVNRRTARRVRASREQPSRPAGRP